MDFIISYLQFVTIFDRADMMRNLLNGEILFKNIKKKHFGVFIKSWECG